MVDICNADMLPENIHAKRLDPFEEERLWWARYIANDASTLKFVIEDTGEKRTITFYKNRNRYDCAADIAKQTAGLRWNEEECAFVAPREVVEYLEAYSAEVKHVYDELDELYNSGYEEAYWYYIWIVNRRAPEATVKDMQSAANDTRRFFQERYNTETACLVGSFRSDLPKNDRGYFEEI